MPDPGPSKYVKTRQITRNWSTGFKGPVPHFLPRLILTDVLKEDKAVKPSSLYQ